METIPGGSIQCCCHIKRKKKQVFETWNYVINIWLWYAKSKQEFENIIGQNIDYFIIDQLQCEGTFRKKKQNLKVM